MQRLLFVLSGYLLSGSVFADEVSVNEFVTGTIISSSDMNQNFQTLVEESNENDERITTLETVVDQSSGGGSGGSTRLVWIDASGEEVGVFATQTSGDMLLVKYPDSPRVFQIINRSTINGAITESGEGQRFEAVQTYFSESNCTGDAFFGYYGLSSTSSIRYSQGVLTPGIDKEGNAVLPDFSAPRVRGKSSDPISQSYTELEADGSITCRNQETDYGTQAWIPGTVTTTPFTLNITLPVQLEWR